MKSISLSSFALIGGLLLSGCQSTSTSGSQIGVTEKKWLRDTIVTNIVYTEGSVTAYRSSGTYYYFKDGILVKTDRGIIPAEKIEKGNQPEQKITGAPAGDLYSELKKLDELRKEGLLTEEEFQAQKKRLLDQQK